MLPAPISFSMNDNLKELHKSILGSSVLALPQSATKVLDLSKNPENGPAEYEVPIVADPGLSAQILRFANSSFFGFSHRITSVRMALTLVSIRTMRNFVLWNAVFSMLPNPKIGNFFLKQFYRTALRRAVFCKIYAGFFKKLDPEHLFVAGLFQDIALPVLVQHWPKEYEVFLKIYAEKSAHLLSLEQERFGWDHAQAGSLLVEEWGLDDALSRHVAGHHKQEIGDVSTPGRLADAIIQLSALLPATHTKPIWHDADLFFEMIQKIHAGAKALIQSGVPSPRKIFELTDAQFNDLLQVAQIEPSQYSLVDCLNEYRGSVDRQREYAHFP